MTLTELFMKWLVINGLIAIAWLWSSIALSLRSRFPALLEARALLKLQYILLFALLAYCMVPNARLPQAIHSPTAQIWSATSMHDIDPSSNAPHFVSITTANEERYMPISGGGALAWLMFTGLVCALLLMGTPLSRSWLYLRRLIRESHLLRRQGSVRIYVGAIDVPFSFWLPRAAYIFVPQNMAADPSDFQTAIHHEIQHHRQRDTRWNYVIQLFRIIFFWNPIIHIWAAQIARTQEYACDEALIGRRRVTPKAYGQCLLNAAKAALNARPAPFGTNGMAVSTSTKTLQRRIEMMFVKDISNYHKLFGTVLMLSALTCIAGTALAANGSIKDRRLSLEEVRSLTTKTAQHSALPLKANKEVLQELNRFVSTPDGRKFMREALERLKDYEPLIKGMLEQHDLPEDLLAVPIVESGYRSLQPNKRAPHAAGLWQFIPATARAHGLQVDDQRDDRLDVNRATEAAMKYFSGLFKEHRDWGLAVLAYNAGSAKVKRGIAKTGSQDAWTLIEHGFENDTRYLAKITAAVIIMKNPSILD